MSTLAAAPRHPGRILDDDFLPRLPAGTTQGELAERLAMSRPRLNDLLRGRRSVTVDTALRLARCFGTTPEFWLEAQLHWDLHQARSARGRLREIDRIEPLPDAAPADARRIPAVAAPPRANQAEAPPPLRLVRDADGEPTAAERAPYYEDFLRRRGLLEEARRFARIQAQLDVLEPRAPEARRRLQRRLRLPEHAVVLPPLPRRPAARTELPAESAGGRS